MATGRIFNIEEFAVHDGPGIRKLVFFKGCPLHCSWCHNPEGISFKKQLLVTHAACKHCGKCDEVCDHTDCVSNPKCISVCPQRIRKISGEDYEAKELAEFLLKGKNVLINSGGGITISGGEPLAQSTFLFELIKYLKPLHIAIETSGFASNSVFKQMLESVDLVMMDIKHTNDLVHKKYTGVSNSLILQNLELLKQGNTDFIIRIPLIPGVNDTRENISETVRLVKGAPNLIRVELMPYHQTAGAKYQMVGMEYEPGFDTSRQVHTWSSLFEENNVKYKVL